jgi:hypothetical protein
MKKLLSIRPLRAVIIVGLAAGIVACGGSGAGAGGGDTVVPPPSSTAETVRVELSNTRLSSSSKDVITATITVKDASNRVLADQPVTVSAVDPQNSIDITQGSVKTDVGGVVTATLRNASDPTNRQITITATSGSKSGTVTLDIVGTAVALSGPSTITNDTDAAYTVSVKSADGAPFAGRQVSLVSSKGNTITPATAITDASGQARFAVRAVAAGADTLTATSTGASASQGVTAAGETLQILAPADGAEIAINTSQAVTVRYTNLAAGSAGK